ncbi:MAG: Gx transporter family protein [Clostridia bacterium]|nr:Gx transporter family protein [Clostridia bacterium]
MGNNNRKRIHQLALLSILTSLALILSYVEAVLPPIFSAIPAVKLGFPNILIIFILYRMGTKEAAAVSFLRIALSALLFGNPITFIYSFAGAFLSLTVMAILKKTNLFSTVGVSIAGGILHNLGQILVAMLLLGTSEIGYYMVVLAFTGTLAGFFIGLCGAFLIRQVDI